MIHYKNDRKCEEFTSSMSLPLEKLNIKNRLTKRIWRSIEFKNKSETLQETITRGFLLRQDCDIYLDTEAVKVFPQQEFALHCFRGASCHVSFPSATSSKVLLEQDGLPSAEELKVYRKSGRCFVGIYLGIDDAVNDKDWLVAIDTSVGHITLSVANDNGLEAIEPDNMINKVMIPSLLLLPWKLSDKFVVVKAEAEWRDDILLDNRDVDIWSNVVLVLNMILKYGDTDDFYRVCAIHDQIEQHPSMDSDIVICILNRILAVLSSYELSDCHDINAPEPTLYTAIRDVRKLISN